MARDSDDALLSVAQAALLLGVHPNTIRTWTDAGRLTAYRINARGDRRYRRGEVAQLLVQDGAADHGVTRSHGGFTMFARLAEGLAAAPTIASVAGALVEVLRDELGLSRAAVYVGEGPQLVLVAHAGGIGRPPMGRPAGGGSPSDGADRVIPLETARAPIGALVIDATEEGRAATGLLPALATTTAILIAAAQRLTRSRRQLQRVRAMRTVTRDLTGTLDLERVLEDVVDRTRTMFAADRAGIWLFDEQSHPAPLTARGLSEAFLSRSTELTRASQTIALEAVRDGRARWARDADRDPAIGEMRSAYAAEGIRTVCIVPLASRGESLGAIGLYHDTDRSWPEEELDLVQAFADQAAVAIQNARLYRSAADQAARMRSIQDLSARLNRLTDVQAIAEAIVTEARTLAEYHDIRVYRVDREQAMCEPIAFTRRMLEGEPGDPRDLLRVAIGQGFTGWVAEHGEPLLVNDALTDGRGKTIEGTEDIPESMLVVPMLYEGRALGVIVLSQLGYNRFSADDLQTMSIFAGYAAQAMANARTYATLVASSAELGRRAESQRRLLDINERLLTTLDPASVLEMIADGLRDVVTYDNLSIYRVDHARAEMVPVLTREEHAEEVSRYVIPFGRGLMGWVVEHGQPILANDALSDPRALQIPGTPPEPEAVVVVPLLSEGRAIGTLNVSRVGGPEVHFSESDFELVKLFAAQASIALRNADTHHAIRQQADTDALTGLGNHGAFQRELGRAIEAVGEERRGRIAMLMMDLDNFKAYNDRYGHPAGDALLHRAATAIYGAARSADRVYRYGGDEFAMILPGTTSVQAGRLGDRVRRAVGSLTAGDGCPVTVTVGVASLPPDAQDRPGLISAADTALFYGKRAGGDRVVRAAELPEDVHDLRDTLEQLASAALREVDDAGVVEHLAEHASALSDARHRTAADGEAPSHAERIGRLASSIAAELDLDERERRDVELSAHLVDLDDRSVARLSSIPGLRGAATVLVGRSAMLAEGARRGRRGRRAEGTAALHVVAAAALYDALITGAHRPDHEPLGRDEALDQLRRHPATFRSDVLDALAVVVRHRRAVARRRRRADEDASEAHGAA
ncbi:MAG: GAF domain-containing protein [Chloroflexi bacterium]|nr:GAF domain-containing protein [Chloroflexota bacterium]